MTAFESIGPISRRQIIVDHFITLGYGEMASYETLMLLLDTNNRDVVRQAVNQAKSALERDYQKVIEPVAGKGYGVVEPKDQFNIAVKRQRQSKKKLRSSLSAVENVDESRLSTEDRGRFSRARDTLQTVLVFHRRHDIALAARKVADDAMGR